MTKKVVRSAMWQCQFSIKWMNRYIDNIKFTTKKKKTYCESNYTSISSFNYLVFSDEINKIVPPLAILIYMYIQ